jgi:transposase
LILGEHNWQWFANETGLRWYTTFRSLIASCALHGLNAQSYLEQVLRLAPHWPVTRMLELAPKYWTRTVSALDAKMRSILMRPWEIAPGDAPVATETEAAA